MKKNLMFPVIILFIIWTCHLGFTADVTITDGNFSGWTSTQYLSGNSVTVSLLNTGGNPDNCLDITTNSGYEVYGVALNNNFVWNPAIQGAISDISLDIDVKSISAWGQGQAVRLIAFQSGTYFAAGDGWITDSQNYWHTIGSGAFSESDFSRWIGTANLDFSQNGSPISFGFAAGNGNSGIYKQYYDNWTITINHMIAPCESDFDKDGDVDGSDLMIFASEFGSTNCQNGSPCQSDFDQDHDVDGSDLVIFASDFGRIDCPNSQ